MFGVSQTSQSWAQMRGEGEDGIYHTFRGSIVFPSGGEKAHMHTLGTVPRRNSSLHA